MNDCCGGGVRHSAKRHAVCSHRSSHRVCHASVMHSVCVRYVRMHDAYACVVVLWPRTCRMVAATSVSGSEMNRCAYIDAPADGKCPRKRRLGRAINHTNSVHENKRTEFIGNIFGAILLFCSALSLSLGCVATDGER